MAESSNPTEQAQGRQPVVVHVFLTPTEQTYMPPRVIRTVVTPDAEIARAGHCGCACGSQSGSGSGE
jgi:hypothetical protein